MQILSRLLAFARLILTGLVLVSCSRQPAPEAGKKDAAVEPRRDLNVLLVTVDTLRADHVGCYGDPKAATPNIDALAARGVRFAQAIASVPLTAPSHASILTGAYPPVHKIRDMGGFILDPSIPTLATILKDAGWSTAAFVGAAVLNRHYGMNRGFDTYNDSMQDESSLKKIPGVVAEVRAEVVAHRAVEWLKGADRSKPFFLWAHFYDPHFPYDPPEPFRSQYPKDPYRGEIAYADGQVGVLLKALADQSLDGRTLVVLIADHGESLGEHGEFTHGVFLYDSTVHVPMMIAGPGVPAGRVVAEQVRSIDVLPTVTDFAGVSKGTAAQGVSLRAALAGGKPMGTDACFLETLYPKTQMAWSELRALRTDRWKMIVAPKPELYSLVDDPRENRNVIEEHRPEAERLRARVGELSGRGGPGEKIEPQLVDEQRKRELAALGYVSAGRRKMEFNMSGPDPKDRVEILGILERASDVMNHDRWREAVAPLEKASREDPSNPLVYMNLVLCYERLGQFDRMEQTCLRAIQNGAETDEILANLGEIYIRRGDLPRAIGHMEAAARLNPGNLQNMDNLATAYLQTGRLDDCRRTLQAVLVQSPNHGMAHSLLGLLEIQSGRPAEARRELELAVQQSPNLAEPYLNLGLLAQKGGDRAKAIECYRNFLKKADPVKHREYIPQVRAALAELGGNP
jgi:choline-sulfatase